MAKVDMTFVAFAVLISSFHKQRGASKVQFVRLGCPGPTFCKKTVRPRQTNRVFISPTVRALQWDSWRQIFDPVPTSDAAVYDANFDIGHRAASLF
jgi:hypothetical protein